MASQSWAWLDRASCTTPKIRATVNFMAEKRHRGYRITLNNARVVCRSCPVKTACAEYVMVDRETGDPTSDVGRGEWQGWGLWFGTTRAQRQAIVDGDVTLEQHFAWLAGNWHQPGSRVYGSPFKGHMEQMPVEPAKVSRPHGNF